MVAVGSVVVATLSVATVSASAAPACVRGARNCDARAYDGASLYRDVTLSGVSCTSAVDCTAVGTGANAATDEHGPGSIGVYATEMAGVWRAHSLSLDEFGSVSCTSPGLHRGDRKLGRSQLLEHPGDRHGDRGVNWVLKEMGDLSNTSDAFTAVSCASVRACTAIGHQEVYSGTSYEAPLYATETDGRWGPLTSFPGGGVKDDGAVLSGIDCTAAADCTAVGEDGAGRPIHVTETAWTWGGLAEVSGPAGGGSFTGVSCTSPTACTAVGTDFQQPIYANEAAGV